VAEAAKLGQQPDRPLRAPVGAPGDGAADGLGERRPRVAVVVATTKAQRSGEPPRQATVEQRGQLAEVDVDERQAVAELAARSGPAMTDRALVDSIASVRST
jgi:hypothetical protein